MNSLTLKNVTIALFLGALGSGIWSMAGAPLVNWFIEVFINFAQIINSSYYDLLHENIGNALHESNSLFLVTLFRFLFILGVIALPIFSYLSWKRIEKLSRRHSKNSTEKSKNEPPKESVEKLGTEISNLAGNSKKLFVFSILLSMVGGPVYISRIITSEYNNKAIVYVERSIEIISPKITNQKFLELRAQYRLISNAAEFYKLHDNLQDIAKSNSIKLPKFEVAR